MAIDLAGFSHRLRPPNLFSLISREAAITLLNGFSYALRAGVAVIYADARPVDRATLKTESFMRGTTQANQFAHPLCNKYRQNERHNTHCDEWDRTIAMKYFDQSWTKAQLYQCHLGVWDMSFPIQINGDVLGVLFSGQMIVKGGPHNWRTALAPIATSVDWKSIANWDFSHPQVVCEKINTNSVPNEICNLTPLAIGHSHDRNITVSTLIARYREFESFGNTLTALLQDLYKPIQATAEQLLLHDMATELITRTESDEKWWQALAEVCNIFSLAAGVGPVEVYCREDLGYVQRVANGSIVHRGDAKWIAAHACLDVPTHQLIRLTELPFARTFNTYARLDEGVLLYRSELAALGDRRISMLFVLADADRPDWRRPFARSFCESIGLRADISEILFRMNRDRMDFEDRVRRVSHQTKTPLQSSYFAIELSERSLLQQNGTTATTNGHLRQAKEAIMRAKTEIRGIYNGIHRTRAPNDIRPILRGIQNELQPQTLIKRCSIILDLPETPLTCNMCINEITVAFSALVDNAVKYSYDDHEIRICATKHSASTLRVHIVNFGVGIPPEVLDQIRHTGKRAMVPDPGRHRDGWGFGLPIAIKFLTDHGGSLDIESNPADSGFRLKNHRFVTSVTVLLPVAQSFLK